MTDVTPSTPTTPATAPGGPPAGWYDDTTTPGRQRWYDGAIWTDHYQTPAAPAALVQPVHVTGPATAASLNVKREVIYNRQQKGHSVIVHAFLGIFCLWINCIYITVSPNHYWHA